MKQGLLRRYGLIDGVPAYFQDAYLATLAMASTLAVGTREKNDFIAPCHLTFHFSSVFTKKTVNDWGDTCDRTDCDSLRGLQARDQYSRAASRGHSPYAGWCDESHNFVSADAG
jgi:hypothetical protein